MKIESMRYDLRLHITQVMLTDGSVFVVDRNRFNIGQEVRVFENVYGPSGDEVFCPGITEI